MNENMSHTLRGPENEEEWRVYHAIRRKALFENRGRFGVYNENHSDEFEKDNHPLILFDRNTPIGVIRVDIHDRVAWFRRVAVRGRPTLGSQPTHNVASRAPPML